MLKQLSIRLLRFFLAGHGMTGRMGKYFFLAVLVGVLAGLVTVGFYWMIGLAKSLVETGCGHEFLSTLSTPQATKALWTRDALLDPGRWILVFLPALGAILGSLLLRRFARVEHARGTDSAVKAFHRGESIPRTVIPVKSVHPSPPPSVSRPNSMYLRTLLPPSFRFGLHVTTMSPSTISTFSTVNLLFGSVGSVPAT